MPKPKVHAAHFRPRARILQLLGDELIRHHRLALFELVKNAYDADSPDVKLNFKNITQPRGSSIVIEDSGEGMDLKTITDVWLEPGADHRAQQRLARKRSPRFNRLPAGEKGIGRFAAHKLGNIIKLITRKHGQPEISVTINWKDLTNHRYLSDAPIEITERPPQHFKGSRTGTLITISELRQTWRRGDVRRLHRAITAMTSPFSTKSEFRATIQFQPDPGWTEDMLGVEELNEYAMWSLEFDINDNGRSYTYDFKPLPSLSSDFPEFIKPRSVTGETSQQTEYFRFPPRHDEGSSKRLPRERAPSLQDLGVGRICGRFLAFDRDREIMEYVSDRPGLETYLDTQGGVRVYRDGLRVHDYGEPGNDWLGLDVRRVQIPRKRLSNNVLIGEVHLSLETSSSLLEKTNREGFVENDAYVELRYAVLSILAEFEALRAFDKDKIRRAIEVEKEERETRFSDGPIAAIESLKRRVLKEGLSDKIGKDVDRVERVFRETHDTLLSAVGAGLGLSMVFHELERGIRSLAKMIKAESPDIPRVRSMADHLVELLRGATTLVRASSEKSVKASTIVNETMYVFGSRFKHHKIEVSSDIDADADFPIRGSRRMLNASLANIIDNAIYWLTIRHGNVPGKKKIWINVSHDFEDGPAIVVADNGTGLQVMPEEAIQPFRTTKAEGMGLGLYFVNLSMKAHSGRVAFPRRQDIGVPRIYNGAVVAMVFKGSK